MKIVADQHIPYVQDYFSHAGELYLRSGRAIKHADVLDADMLLVRSITRVDAGLLQDSQVRFVGSITAGADHLDTAWLDQQQIIWRVATGFNAQPVADYVVSAVTALQAQQMLTNQQPTAAVIGVGNVGKLVVKHLKQLGFNVILCDPLRAEYEPDFISTPLTEITNVDLICLHVPLTELGAYPTYHFINKNFLQQQRPGCVLLNASRGAVIDTEILLQYGKHLVWCLDVWENEPVIDKRLLEQAYIATPHIAGYSIQAKLRGTEMIYRAAVELGIIPALKQNVSLTVPADKKVFDPLSLSEQMKATLLPAAGIGELFDTLRNQFNYRHELV